jgi:hypothetical protein
LSPLVAVHSRQQFTPAGDEPHYLLIAHSLVVDHDLKVSNNYEQADYLTYYAGPLRPHYAPPARDGSLYSGHAPGLPVLVAPALAIGGYRAVVLWVAAIAAVGTAVRMEGRARADVRRHGCMGCLGCRSVDGTCHTRKYAHLS